jgi:hypothetical protein
MSTISPIIVMSKGIRAIVYKVECAANYKGLLKIDRAVEGIVSV